LERWIILFIGKDRRYKKPQTQPVGVETGEIILAWIKASVNKELFLCLPLSPVHLFPLETLKGGMAALTKNWGLRTVGPNHLSLPIISACIIHPV
jgi:hypothetical protein